MDTELEFVAERLRDFRDKVKAARAASDLIDLIDKPLLTVAGWKVHADSQSFIGATKINDAGDEFELRVGRLNRTIAGTMTPKRRPAKQTKIDTFRLMMADVFREPQLTVRRHQIDEFGWADMARQI